MPVRDVQLQLAEVRTFAGLFQRYSSSQPHRGASMPKKIITSPKAPTTGFTPGQPVSPLAQAIRFGNMLFVSGTGSLDPVTGEVVPGDIVVQTKQTLVNLMNVLDAAGATAKNIVNMRVILRNVADFPRFNET